MSDTEPQFRRYERARNSSRVIYRMARFRWVVQFDDSRNAHCVTLSRPDGDIDADWSGRCTCPYQKHEGETCAHMWAVYLAAHDGVLEVSDPREGIESDCCPVCERPTNNLDR